MCRPMLAYVWPDAYVRVGLHVTNIRADTLLMLGLYVTNVIVEYAFMFLKYTLSFKKYVFNF